MISPTRRAARAKLLLDCRAGYGKRARARGAACRRTPQGHIVARRLAEGPRGRSAKGARGRTEFTRLRLERTIDEFPDHALGAAALALSMALGAGAALAQ